MEPNEDARQREQAAREADAKRHADKRWLDALLTEVQDWEDAQSIRRYVRAQEVAQGRVGTNVAARFDEWRARALESANQLDPIIRMRGRFQPIDDSMDAVIQRLEAAGIRVRHKPTGEA